MSDYSRTFITYFHEIKAKFSSVFFWVGIFFVGVFLACKIHIMLILFSFQPNQSLLFSDKLSTGTEIFNKFTKL